MADDSSKVSNIGNELAISLWQIKDDLKEYLGKDNCRVVFTIRDRHVHDSTYLAWRYWIGIDEDDLNPIGYNGEKLKIYKLLGHGEKYDRSKTADQIEIDNSPPCLFEQDISVSGTVTPGTNWMFVGIPDKLAIGKLKKEKELLYKHFSYFQNIPELKFIDIINKFFEIIYDDEKNSIKKEYLHTKDKNGEGHNREIKKVELNKAANAALGKKVSESDIKEFPFNDENKYKEPEYLNGRYLRYLMRLIDYYYIFKNYKYNISYALIVGGYHLVTFYLLFKELEYLKIDLKRKKKKEILKRSKDKSWCSIDGVYDFWRLAGCPKFKPDWEKNSPADLFNFLGEIDNIIKIGWTNAINNLLTKIGNQAALRGDNLESVLKEFISYNLLLCNPDEENHNSTKHEPPCEFYNSCDVEVGDCIKYIVKVNTNINTNDKHCNKYKSEKPCITVKADSKEGKVQIRFRRNRTSDVPGTKITLTRLLNTFISQYENVIKPSWLNTLKSACIAILIDSYSHNISAHSLAALKWWIENRSNILGKRFYLNNDENVLKELQPQEIEISDTLTQISNQYYKLLGIQGRTEEENYFSLLDYVKFLNTDDLCKTLSFTEEVKDSQRGDAKKFHPQFPLPIDHGLWQLLRFLRDKGAFWSGVTRDMTYGGESKTWFKILWEDFANNPLYLGTIAKSEGVTLINIDLEVYDSVKETWQAGRFATIDMSLVNIDEKIAQSKKLSLSEDEIGLLKSNIDEALDQYNFSVSVDENYIEGNKYSKYCFVKPGRHFAYFKNLLSDEDKFSVFLPGGIIGEHALFTLIENTIRNIKHYKDDQTLEKIQNSGIDLCISLREKNLMGVKSTSNGNKTELFKVGVWLKHLTPLSLSNNELLIQKVVDSSLSLIVDEYGKPRMGGNSQDKICAAMLMNGNFSSVENKVSDRDNKYYPWITYATAIETDGKLTDCYIDYNHRSNAEEKQNSLQVYAEKIKDNKECYLKKYFHLWRSEDFFHLKNVDDLENDNVSRYKFVVLDKSKNGNERKELIIKAREKGVIRIIDRDDDELQIKELSSEDMIKLIYSRWLQGWIKTYNKVIFKYDSGNPTTIGKLTFEEKSNIYYTGLSEPDNDTNNPIIYLSHGTACDLDCNLRSYGVFFSTFFTEIRDKESFSDMRYHINNSLYKCKNSKMVQLYETIMTRIVIFDNRLYDRIPKNKREMYKNSLLLEVFKEDDQSLKKWNDREQTNILIMHLSFIESLKDETGIQYSESRIGEFIDNEIKDLSQADNFIFVITSGRGRDEWRRHLTNDQKRITMFKPVEALLTAIEAGISINDNFDVKYNLVKVLFGS